MEGLADGVGSSDTVPVNVLVTDAEDELLVSSDSDPVFVNVGELEAEISTVCVTVPLVAFDSVTVCEIVSVRETVRDSVMSQVIEEEAERVTEEDGLDDGEAVASLDGDRETETEPEDSTDVVFVLDRVGESRVNDALMETLFDAVNSRDEEIEGVTETVVEPVGERARVTDCPGVGDTTVIVKDSELFFVGDSEFVSVVVAVEVAALDWVTVGLPVTVIVHGELV
jgi:hypothetical protein